MERNEIAERASAIAGVMGAEDDDADDEEAAMMRLASFTVLEAHAAAR